MSAVCPNCGHLDEVRERRLRNNEAEVKRLFEKLDALERMFFPERRKLQVVK
jgi:uncharacterized Zn finger protein (UPF0148 family)